MQERPRVSGGGRVVGARYFPVYFEMNTDIVVDGRRKPIYIPPLP